MGGVLLQEIETCFQRGPTARARRYRLGQQGKGRAAQNVRAIILRGCRTVKLHIGLGEGQEDGGRKIASLTMSAVSSTFRAHSCMHSEKSAISLS